MTLSTVPEQTLRIQPDQVHDTLQEHILADGYDLVLDLEKSKGSWVYDSKNDRKYLDFFSCFASMPIGYNHPKLDTPEFRDRIATAALNKPANSDFYTTQMAEFVDTFARVAVPAPFNEHMFFVEGGALGVENAIKAAFDWKVRKNKAKGLEGEIGSKVIHLKDAFHGRTGYTLSLTNTDPKKTMYFPKFDWPRIDNPKVRFPLDEEVLKEVEKSEKSALDQFRAAVEAHPNDIAAFVMEPIQGEGGDNHFRKEFFEQIRALCDEHEIIMIFDEVQTGVGLTGSMWAFQQIGVAPDMFCFGKKTQVCGFASNDRIFDIPDNVFRVSSRINSTWGGNLVDMVRSQRYFEIIEEEDLVANAASTGEYLLGEMEKVASESDGRISNVRGRGLMIAFDLPSGDDRDALVDDLMKNGLVVLDSGEKSVRFRPHLILTRDEAAQGVEIMRKTLGL